MSIKPIEIAQKLEDLFDELIYNIDKISQEISESSLSDKQLDNDVLQYELDKLNE